MTLLLSRLIVKLRTPTMRFTVLSLAFRMKNYWAINVIFYRIILIKISRVSTRSANICIIRHDVACHEHAAAGIRDTKMLQRSLEELWRACHIFSSVCPKLSNVTKNLTYRIIGSLSQVAVVGWDIDYPDHCPFCRVEVCLHHEDFSHAMSVASPWVSTHRCFLRWFDPGYLLYFTNVQTTQYQLANPLSQVARVALRFSQK